MSKIRAILADDEPLARKKLSLLLASDTEVEVVEQCTNMRQTVEAVNALRPALLFLDVQMPDGDGFAALGQFKPEAMPYVIFTTAYDQYALRAFDANALDYLLKPFSDERWESALARAKTRLDERHLREFGRSVLHMLAERSEPGRRYIDRLVVKGNGTTRFIRVTDIDWIEGAGVYVNLHVAGKELLYRSALNELAGHLDPLRFIRVHRSAIVNIDSILQLQPISHGEFEIVLKDGHRSRVSRTYRAQLERRLGQSL